MCKAPSLEEAADRFMEVFVRKARVWDRYDDYHDKGILRERDSDVIFDGRLFFDLYNSFECKELREAISRRREEMKVVKEC